MEKNRLSKAIYMFLFLWGLFAIFYVLLISGKGNETSYSFNDDLIKEWNDDWEMFYDGNVVENVSLPTKVDVKRGSTVMLRKTIPDRIKEYNCIMLFGKRQDIEVSIGGIQRSEHSNKSNRLWGKTTPSGAVFVPLYNTDGGEEVIVHITSDSVYSGQIGKIYLGNDNSLLLMLIKKNLSGVLCASFVFIIGIICIICYVIYSSYFEISKMLHYLAFFAFFSAVWDYSNMAIAQILGRNLNFLDVIGYACYMMIPLLLIQYVNGITKNRYKKAISVLSAIISANFFVQSFLFIVKHFGLFEMRYADHLVFLATLIFIITICVLEIKRSFDVRTKCLSLGCLILTVGSVLESFQLMTRDSFGGLSFYIGSAFIFTVISFSYIIVCIGKEQRARKDAENSNRAKSLFLATMSHEIKTPINSVIGMNEMIIRDTKEETTLEYAANIKKASEHLVSLVNDVLDYSRIESGKMDIVNVEYKLKPLLQDLILMTETKSKEKNLELILDIDENLPSVLFGDKIRIKQVAANLLSNAIKYTSHGSVTFSVKNLDMKDENAVLLFSVKDTGIGIKQDKIEELMDAFARTDNVKNSSIEGTGLGLSISTNLLELMGSKLEVKSEYEKGSDFYFVIAQKVIDGVPCGLVRMSKPKIEKKRTITFKAPEIRVLTVDDTKLNNKVLKGLLKPTEMSVDVCESGEECLNLCDENMYDIIFMDHMMPQMDGIETFNRLRANKESKSCDAIVIVLTANTVAGAEEFYKECGFDYYMKKPIDTVELNTVLQKFIPGDKVFPLDNE